MLTDEALKEAIKEVKIETKPTANWDKNIERRYMDYHITRQGKALMVQFMQEIGPGPIMVDSWYGMKRIREAATEAGFMLMKNKRNGNFALAVKGKNPDDSFMFNPELLDTENVEENPKDEKIEVGQSA
jgi:hypothetical protein